MRKKNKMKTGFILALCASPWMLVAASAHAEPAYDRCMKQAATSFAYNECGKRWIAREEGELTLAWRAAYASLSSPEAKKSLLREQRNWIIYKDSACRFLGTDEFGSMGWSQNMPACVARVVRVRMDQLRGYVSSLADR
jgi:uncharacterized protein YecT (DUF1311 family)